MEYFMIFYDDAQMSSYVILCHPMSSYYLHSFLHPPKKAMAFAQQASSLTSPPASRTSSSLGSSLGISEKPKDRSQKTQVPKVPKHLKLVFQS